MVSICAYLFAFAAICTTTLARPQQPQINWNNLFASTPRPFTGPNSEQRQNNNQLDFFGGNAQQQQQFGRPGGGGNQNPFLPPGTPVAVASTTATPGAVTTASPQFLACLQACPSTSEYNPICGNDGINYHNNGRLACAVRCGQDVAAVRMGTCSAL